MGQSEQSVAQEDDQREQVGGNNIKVSELQSMLVPLAFGVFAKSIYE